MWPGAGREKPHLVVVRTSRTAAGGGGGGGWKEATGTKALASALKEKPSLLETEEEGGLATEGGSLVVATSAKSGTIRGALMEASSAGRVALGTFR